MTIKCFMIEPILGDPIRRYEKSAEYKPARKYEEWPPSRMHVGWRRPDTGEEHHHTHEFGVGAMWFATWYPKNMTWDNEKEPHLIVCCPNGSDTRDWDIDSRCSNCGSPEDRLHRCWIRHGVPPVITVDKAGPSCNAGAGSIALPHWHGFLTQGVLSETK